MFFFRSLGHISDYAGHGELKGIVTNDGCFVDV